MLCVPASALGVSLAGGRKLSGAATTDMIRSVGAQSGGRWPNVWIYRSSRLSASRCAACGIAICLAVAESSISIAWLAWPKRLCACPTQSDSMEISQEVWKEIQKLPQALLEGNYPAA